MSYVLVGVIGESIIGFPSRQGFAGSPNHEPSDHSHEVWNMLLEDVELLVGSILDDVLV